MRCSSKIGLLLAITVCILTAVRFTYRETGLHFSDIWGQGLNCRKSRKLLCILWMPWKRSTWERTVQQLAPYPADQFQGRGIVIVGGRHHLPQLWAVVNLLRAVNCSLGIELWRSADMSAQECAVFEKLGLNVKCRILETMFRKYSALQGYQFKVPAILHSHFREVLFLDADNVPVEDPSPLFSHEAYKSTGAVFWPDYWNAETNAGETAKPNHVMWRVIGVDHSGDYEQKTELDSAQVLVDKERHWAALNLAVHFNLDRWYYDILHGDKDTFRFAWLALGAPFHLIRTPAGMVGARGEDPKDKGKFCGNTMSQHGPDGQTVFLHRNVVKFGTPFWTDDSPRLWTEFKDPSPDTLANALPTAVICEPYYTHIVGFWDFYGLPKGQPVPQKWRILEDKGYAYLKAMPPQIRQIPKSSDDSAKWLWLTLLTVYSVIATFIMLSLSKFVPLGKTQSFRNSVCV